MTTLPVASTVNHGLYSTRHGGGQSKKLSSHTLGSTESLKAVYMGKTFTSLKPGSPSHAAVNIVDQRIFSKAAF